MTSDHIAIRGIAWVFDQPDNRGDIVIRGAFRPAMPRLPMLLRHDPRRPLGFWDDVHETDRGLEARGRLFARDVPDGEAIYAHLLAGRLNGLSVGFDNPRHASRLSGGRIISLADLVEISLVSRPEHPGARVRSVSAVKLPPTDPLFAEHVNRAYAAHNY